MFRDPLCPITLLVAATACSSWGAAEKPKNGPRNVPPAVTAMDSYGQTQDKEFNPFVYRDGGGGGFVNGFHIIAFSDTTTTNTGIDGDSTSFVHNTISYFGSEASSPNQLQNLAGKGSPGKMTFVEPVFNAVSPAEKKLGGGFAIWPNSNFIDDGNNTAAAIFQCVKVEGGGTPTTSTLYNTLVNIQVDPPAEMKASELKVSRPVPALFRSDEVMYGSFGLWKDNTFTYLFAANGGNGIKVASAPNGKLSNKETFRYWDGKRWSKRQPRLHDVSSNILTYTEGEYGPNSGDIFWSPYFNTYLAVFHTPLSNHLNIAYALDQKLTGRWSEPQSLFNITLDAACPQKSTGITYSGHAYPNWDQTGKSLLLSWSSCAYFVNMAQVTFA